MIHTLRQLQFLPVAATAACLRSVGRIDLNYLFTSIFRFVFKGVKKHAPGGVSDTFVQTAELPHVVDTKVFYDNGVKRVNELSGLLMGEVMPLVGNPLVDSGNNFAGFSAFWRALNLFGEFTLRFCKSLFFFAEKPRVWDGLSIRKRGKVCHAHVDARNRLNGLQDRHMFNVTNKAHKPFPGCGAADSAGFDSSLDGPVFADSDAAYLGELDVVISKGETQLRVAERIVTELTTKAWIARFIAPLDPLEEGSKGQIDTGGNVLKGLAIDVSQKWMLLLKLFNSIALVVSRKTYLIGFPNCFALFEKMVIEPATGVKRRFKRMFLHPIRIDSIFESFSHTYTLTKELYNVKDMTLD